MYDNILFLPVHYSRTILYFFKVIQCPKLFLANSDRISFTHTQLSKHFINKNIIIACGSFTLKQCLGTCFSMRRIRTKLFFYQWKSITCRIWGVNGKIRKGKKFITLNCFYLCIKEESRTNIDSHTGIYLDIDYTL